MIQQKLSGLRLTQPLTVTLVPTGGHGCCASAALVSTTPASAAAAKTKPQFLIVVLPWMKRPQTLHNLSARATGPSAHGGAEVAGNAGNALSAGAFYLWHRQRDFL